jgi:hypothetical protein
MVNELFYPRLRTNLEEHAWKKIWALTNWTEENISQWMSRNMTRRLQQFRWMDVCVYYNFTPPSLASPGSLHTRSESCFVFGRYALRNPSKRTTDSFQNESCNNTRIFSGIDNREVGNLCSTYGRDAKFTQNFCRKTWKEKTILRAICVGRGIILKQILKKEYWTHLAQDKDQWRVLLNIWTLRNRWELSDQPSDY